MPRDGSNIYTQPFPNVVADTTIESAVYNGFTNDVAIDLNAPRPITAGGTGANNARDAMINLSGEIAKQVVTNYDSQPFVAGSFTSLGSATAGPVDGHAFMGICYLKDDNNIVLEARDQGDTTKPGRLYVREKKAGVWDPWKQEGLTMTDAGSGNVATGISGEAADMFFGLRGTAPASYFGVNTKADLSGTDAFKVNKDGSVVFLGNVTFPATPPVNPTDATNKAYVDAGDAALTANVNNRVLRSGDTMTGGLTAPNFLSNGNVYYFNNYVNSLSFTGDFGGAFILNGGLHCGPVTSTGTSNFIDRCLVAGAGQPCFAVHNTTAHQAWGFWVDPSGPGGMLIGYTDAAGNPSGNVASFTSAPSFTVSGTASKPGGGAWAATSDARIKTVKGDYDSGLDAVTALRPVRYTYKGNDGVHQDAADKGTEFIGLVAQDAEGPMPEMVSQYEGSIDGVAVSDLRNLDTTPLLFALVNSIKELKARVEALEAG